MAKRKSQIMGRLIICLGLVSKIVQLIGSAFGITAAGGSLMTLVTTCLLVGGLSVYASEKMNFTSVFAAISAVATLAGIMNLKSNDLLFFSMAACFLSFGLMLITLRRPLPIFLGILIILLTAAIVMHSYFKIISLPPQMMTAMLCSIYAFVGIGILF